VKPKRRRLYFVIAGMVLLGAAAALVLYAMNDTLVFFYDAGGATVRFRVTDTAKTVPVVFKGILPDLFREGQGVVAEGKMGEDGVFVASDVLAKHDEKYMPKEVVDALKKSGRWQEGAGAQ
jgi:cytochrome c-type biogenesis protein CcmE